MEPEPLVICQIFRPLNCWGKLLFRILIFSSLIHSFIKSILQNCYMQWSVLGSKTDELSTDLKTDVNKHLQYDEHQKLCNQTHGNTEEEARSSTYPNSLGVRDGWPGKVCGPCKTGSTLGRRGVFWAPVDSPWWVKTPHRKYASTLGVHSQERRESFALPSSTWVNMRHICIYTNAELQARSEGGGRRVLKPDGISSISWRMLSVSLFVLADWKITCGFQM